MRRLACIAAAAPVALAALMALTSEPAAAEPRTVVVTLLGGSSIKVAASPGSPTSGPSASLDISLNLPGTHLDPDFGVLLGGGPREGVTIRAGKRSIYLAKAP